MASIAFTTKRQILKLPLACLKRTTSVHFPQYKCFFATTTERRKKYTADHEWIDLPCGTTVGTFGISIYAAQALGDIVYVELPTLSEKVSAGDIVGVVESVKSASDIKTPVSGTVVSVNSLLEEKPSTMSAKPEQSGESGGWIAKIEVDAMGMAELEELMNEEEYKAFIDEQG